MIKEIIIFLFLTICCSTLPTQPLQKVMAVIVQPESVRAPANLADKAEIIATAETGWKNYGYGGKYGGYGQNYGSGPWRRGGSYRGGYFGGGWKHRG